MAVKRNSTDIIFSQAVRTIGYCEACQRRDKDQLTCAHIIGRKYKRTRWDFRNCMSLCYSCHRYYTDNPIEFTRFVDQSWAAQYLDECRILAYSTTQPKPDEKERRAISRKVVNGELSLQEARQIHP